MQKLLEQWEKARVGEKDRINRELVQLFAWRTVHLIRIGDGEAASRYFDEVIKRRLDPNEQNDVLRLQIALNADSADAWYFAKGRVAELKSNPNLTFYVRMRLLLAGFYGQYFPLVFYVTIGLAMLLVVVAFFNPRITLFSSSNTSSRSGPQRRSARETIDRWKSRLPPVYTGQKSSAGGKRVQKTRQQIGRVHSASCPLWAR